jgi:hypothetical protein
MKFKLEFEAEGETFGDLEQAAEQLVIKIREDYWSGSDSNDTGGYHFNINEPSKPEEPKDLHRIAEFDGGDKFIVAREELYYPVPVPGGAFSQGAMIVVLCANLRNEYAAYIGGVIDDKAPEPADLIWIAEHGVKITFKEATKYFPWIVSEYYRR